MNSKLPPDVSSLDIDICDICNFSCVYCYHHDMNGHKMTENTIDRIVSIIPKRDDKPFAIHFFGGEPLIALERIKYFVKRCEEEGLNMRYGLTSNLSMLNEDVVSYMKEKGISIHCSIDGNEKVQDTQRPKHGGQPTSHIIRDKVKYALDITPNDSVRMTILRKNLPEYFDSVRYVFEQLGFNSCAPVLVPEEEWSKDDYELLESELKRLVDWIYQEVVKHNRWRSVSFIEKAKPASMRRGTQMCGAGMNNVAISLSGDVYPCHRFTRADSEGMFWLCNIHDDGWLMDFLKRRILVNSLHNNNFEMCLHCPAFETCGGGCPHINVTSFGKEEKSKAYLPPYNYCEIKRRQHHWGTYLWRKIYQLKVEKERQQKRKVAPAVKPSPTGKTQKKNMREKMRGAKEYKEFYDKQKFTREMLIEKFAKKKQSVLPEGVDIKSKDGGCGC